MNQRFVPNPNGAEARATAPPDLRSEEFNEGDVGLAGGVQASRLICLQSNIKSSMQTIRFSFQIPSKGGRPGLD